MRLNSLDTGTWMRISADLGEISEEIMEDDDSDEYPSGSAAAEVYEACQRAAMLALFISASPGLTRDELDEKVVRGTSS